MRRGFVLTASVLIGSLAGCGGGSNDDPQVEPAVEATVPEATTGPPTEPAEAAEPGELTVQVFRESSDSGVASDIERLDDVGTLHWFADVGNSGVASLPQPCQAGERFQATPKVPDFLRAAPQPCAATITFRLHGTRATLALIQLADNATRTGDLLVAQANYGLAAERLQYANPDEARHLRVLAATAAGRILGVQNPTTSIDGQETISSEVADRLRTFQREAQLPQTGELDSATREAISKMPAAALLQRAIETPAVPVTNPSVQLRSTVQPAQVRTVTLSASAAARQRQNVEESAAGSGEPRLNNQRPQR